MPTGCFEQSSSATYPNILTALYLRETKRMTPEIGLKLDAALAAGYQKLLTFEDEARGGFSLYPDQATSPYLTAYGILILGDLAKVYPVDPALLPRSIRALMASRRADGDWVDERGGPASTAYIGLGPRGGGTAGPRDRTGSRSASAR